MTDKLTLSEDDIEPMVVEVDLMRSLAGMTSASEGTMLAMHIESAHKVAEKIQALRNLCAQRAAAIPLEAPEKPVESNPPVSGRVISIDVEELAKLATLAARAPE